MTAAQGALVAGAALAATVALLASWRERARTRRRDLDAVGPIDWPLVQMLALIALAGCGLLALHLD